ncbi:MAG: SIMPL domain-containing protein [Pseudomonadota bacterium]
MPETPGSKAAQATTLNGQNWRLVFAAAALCAAVIAALASSAARADESARSITVSGSAEARIAPDMAMLRMSVVEDDINVDAARSRADAIVATALETLRAADIDAGDIDTSALRVDPQYRWHESTRRQILTGYRVTRGIEVRLLDLPLLGELLVALSEAGVNRVEAPVLGLQDRESVYQEVLAAAAENARQRAAVLATTLNEKIGAVLSVQTQRAPNPMPMRREMAMMAADESSGGAASYQSGDLDFSVNLTVSFALVD